LALEAAASPISAMRVSFQTPSFDEVLELNRDPEVRVSADALDADALGVDVALDDERPRRLTTTRAIALRALLRPDLELTPGEHWLFAAPVAASGLVPVRSAEATRSAVARRFFWGKRPDAPNAEGPLWIRKPEGSYDAAGSRRVLCDVLAFSAQGEVRAQAPALRLERPAARIPADSPGFLHDLASGEYRISAALPGYRSASLAFTVNAELGGSR